MMDIKLRKEFYHKRKKKSIKAFIKPINKSKQFITNKPLKIKQKI